MEKRLPTYKIIVNPDDNETGVYGISLVDTPAIEVDWIKLSKELQDILFSANKDKQMLFGPLLIPNKLILRKASNGDLYNIMFDAETIQVIADKYNETKINDIFNFQHSERVVDAVLLQNWITGEKDKSQDYGFDLPSGSWFCGVKVKDESFWMNEVKSEKVKGFSIEVKAETELIKMTSEMEDKNKNIKLMDYKTKDGLTLRWEGDAAVGSEVFLVLEDGTSVSADNGEYELEDGTKIIIADGKVSEIIAAEIPESEDMAEAPVTDAPATTNGPSNEELVTMFDELRGVIAELSSRLDALENVEPTAEEEATLSKVKELEEKLSIISEKAGAPSIKVKSDLEIKREEKETYILNRLSSLKKW
jgi:hypothetical protein